VYVSVCACVCVFVCLCLSANASVTSSGAFLFLDFLFDFFCAVNALCLFNLLFDLFNVSLDCFESTDGVCVRVCV